MRAIVRACVRACVRASLCECVSVLRTSGTFLGFLAGPVLIATTTTVTTSTKQNKEDIHVLTHTRKTQGNEETVAESSAESFCLDPAKKQTPESSFPGNLSPCATS